MRPGGKVLIGESVDDPRYPCFDPRLAAHETAWELLYATARRRGAAVDVGRCLPRVCQEAGLRVIDARGSFSPLTPAQEWLQSTRTVLQSTRRAIVGYGLANDADVNALAAELAAAQEHEFRTVLGRLTVHVIAEVPRTNAD